MLYTTKDASNKLQCRYFNILNDLKLHIEENKDKLLTVKMSGGEYKSLVGAILKERYINVIILLTKT